MAEYSEWEDDAINFEISKRLGMTYVNGGHLADMVSVDAELNWVGNANHALALMIDESDFELTTYGKWEAKVNRYLGDGNYKQLAAGHDDNPARAVAICWLGWQDYEAEQKAKRAKA